MTDEKTNGSCCQRPKRKWKRAAVVVLLAALLPPAAAAVSIYSGAYSVAATEPHSRPVEW